MPDVFDKCRTWASFCDRVVSSGIYPYYKATHDRRDAAVVGIGGREVVMAGTTDYLGLSCDPRVKEAAMRATGEFGAGCGGSRLMNGTLEPHEELEHRLAAFLGHEAAIVTSTGFQASLALSALFGATDVVYADKLNHASLVEAVRLSAAASRRYRHNDTTGLARALEHAETGTGGAIVTDGVFSMTGDVCDLPGLTALRDRHGLRLVVDAAHDIGILGKTGNGAAEYFGLEAHVDLLTFSLSKAFGTSGGVLAGPREVITYLRHQARSVLFSAALPPACTAAALAALDIIREEPWHRERALRNARLLREGLREQGHDIGEHPTTIIAVPMGGTEECARYWTGLLEEGVFTNAAIAPAVPEGAELLRLSATAAHTDTHIERILAAFAKVGGRPGPSNGERAVAGLVGM